MALHWNMTWQTYRKRSAENHSLSWWTVLLNRPTANIFSVPLQRKFDPLHEEHYICRKSLLGPPGISSGDERRNTEHFHPFVSLHYAMNLNLLQSSTVRTVQIVSTWWVGQRVCFLFLNRLHRVQHKIPGFCTVIQQKCVWLACNKTTEIT